MCGIGGIYLSREGNFNSKKLKDLWDNLEDRGTDASGIAYLWNNADKPIIKKAAKAASDHSKIITNEMGKMITYALLHTRYTTQGSTRNNSNNHPVIRDSIIMTHNGVIANDKKMFNKIGIKPHYQVDTEALVAGIAHKGIEWTANEAYGSMSIAWVNKEDVTTVNLFTNGRNPLVIAQLECGSYIWASGYHHLEHYNPIKYFHAQPGIVYKLTQKGIITKRVNNIKGEKWGYPMTYSQRRVF